MFEEGLDHPAIFRKAEQQTAISQVLTVMFCLCYIKTALTSPGGVPDTPEWRMGGIEGTAPITREVKVTGERRHSKWCLKYKPDRCHHCRVCKTCVLKMDHHCPWIMNCVGFANHKFFFLLVNYAASTCAYVGYHIFFTVRDCANVDIPNNDRFVVVLCFMLTVIWGTLMGTFAVFHYSLMLRGVTTIEHCEKASVESSGMMSKSSLYYRGIYENMKSVLGPRFIFWPFPFDWPSGDGINFDVADTFEAKATLSDYGQ